MWLAWPGYIHIDAPHSLLLNKNNWHPVFITYLLEFFYQFSGPHVYYFLCLILIPFYLSLLIFFYAFWHRFHSYYAGLLLCPAFIGNIFFQNFVLHSSSLSPMWIFLCYALTFYRLLNPIQGKTVNILYSCFTAFVFFIALWLRHNALIQLYPLVFIWLAQLNNHFHFSLKKIFALFVFLSFGIIGTSIFIPKALQKYPSYPAQHIILHQIAGACVPSNDLSCFKESWYQPNVPKDKVKNEYMNNLFFADRFSILQAQYQVFKGEKLEGLYTKWLHSIFKHPYNYTAHLLRFLKQMWSKPVEIENKNHIQNTRFCEEGSWLDGRYDIKFPPHERCLQLSQQKSDIYNLLRRNLPFISTLTFILLSFICSFLSGYLLWKYKKNILLLYTFILSSTGILSYILFCIFSPTDSYRYVHPALICPLSALIGLLAYFCTITDIKSLFKRFFKNHLVKGIALIMLCILLHALYLSIYHPTARIDFETKAQDDNQVFRVFAKDTPTGTPKLLTWIPWWMENNNSFGYVYESNKKKAYFEVHVFRPSSITIRVIGDDVLDGQNSRMNTKVQLKSVKINGQEVLDIPKTIWHDAPFNYTYHAQANERIYVETIWDTVKEETE